MKYLLTDEFNKNLATLFKQGGQNKKVVDKMQSLLGHHSSRFDDDPISTFLPKTNHGETRLSNCEKFKIYDSYRLITQLSNNTRTLCFIGNHDGSESFLKKPRKTEIYVDDENRLHSLKITKSVAKFSHNVFESDLVDTRLISRLDKEDLNFVFSGLPPSSISVLGYLNTLSNDDDIINCLNDIDDLKKQNLVLDVLLELRKGDKKAAKRRINLEKGELKHLTSVETVNIKSGEDVIVLEVGSDEYSLWIEKFRESSNYFDWMLFTHPKQQEIIEENYSGPSLLNGVSGSGKTCIIVKRAIRLAMKKPEKQILILTLNRSLSNLIHNLIEHACPKKYLDYIKVTSFFELCQELLKLYEPLDTKKFFSDVTWRHNEHIDQIWREYYRCHLNNYDALELLEIHKHFNERSIKAEKYIREEFDWIRSRFSYKERNSYLLTDRKGRAYPLLQQWRKMILNGLSHWEQKMKDVGVIDYLGLSSKLMEHYSELNILYSHVLIDEVQDFGNIELKIIRKLVDKGENDIFMAGDENQKATVKYRSFNASGINIHSSRKKEIKVNYRNSREILNAAYSIYKSNYKKYDNQLVNNVIINNSITQIFINIY